MPRYIIAQLYNLVWSGSYNLNIINYLMPISDSKQIMFVVVLQH